MWPFTYESRLSVEINYIRSPIIGGWSYYVWKGTSILAGDYRFPTAQAAAVAGRDAKADLVEAHKIAKGKQ